MIKPPRRNAFLRLFGQWKAISLITMLIGFVPALQAQDTGTVSGQVLDTSTGKYIEGAEVYVDGTLLLTNTERGGLFTLKNVPAGSHTLVITYPGLEIKNEPITVKAGETTNVAIRLGSEVLMLEAVNVSTAREGMAQAQALQKVALNYKIVAANDQFGEISEGNIGEYLKFLPGVGIDYNSNDARGISLRGLRTQFTLVAVDGTPMASAASGGDNRRFELEQIASNNVETYEIYKTVTPDIPADATGGFINMVTKSAFDREDVSVLSYNLSFNVPSTNLTFSPEGGTWGQGEHYVVRPNLELNYARRINEKLGVNFNYRLSEIYHDSPRSEYTWLYSGATANPRDPTILNYNQNNEQKLTHREAFATKVDYQISDRTKLTAMGQWNWYDLTFSQRAIVFQFGTNATNLPGVNSSQSGANGRGIQNSFLQRNKYGTTVHGNLRLDHEFNDVSKAWLIGYASKANSKYRDANKGFVSTNVALTTAPTSFRFDNILDNPRLPVLTMSQSLDTLRSLANYTFNGNNNDNFRARPDTAHDTKRGVQGHYSYDIEGLWVPIKVQAGVAYDDAEREIARQVFRVNGLPAVSGAALQSFKEDSLFDYGFGFGSAETLNIYKMYDTYFKTAPTTILSTDDYRLFEENNIAGYLRVDAKFFNDLSVITGVRWEKHEMEASAQSRASTRSKLAAYDIDYDNFYPSLTIRYNPSFEKKLVFRAGASRTVGHPDYAEVLPTANGEASAGAGNGNVTLSDPALEPYYVTNYDVAVEYYIGKSGVASVSLFRKEVEGFIVSETVAVTDPAVQQFLSENGYSPAEFSAGSASIRRNGKDSQLNGVELQYNQNFSFLPKPFNGLSLQSNYTKIDIDADDLTTQYAQQVAAVTEAFNVVLGYRIGKFNSTVSTNWTTDVLITTVSQGSGATLGQLSSWKSPEMKTNIKLEYNLSRHYNIYVEARNIFYEREEYFSGYSEADQALGIYIPGRSFEYGDPIYVLGVKGTF